MSNETTETMIPVFREFQKIPRLSRNVVITEKLDGTNGLIHIGDDGSFLVGSRTRWITPGQDNYGFAKWAHENKEELLKLGPGSHYGEWWGAGIQRKYNIGEKRFSLFNTHRWIDDSVRPKCCHVVPIVINGVFSFALIESAMNILSEKGSLAAPGFMNPEGIVIFHEAARILFKKTIEKDDAPKGQENV